MSNSKATPGPWEYKIYSNNKGFSIRSATTQSGIITECFPCYSFSNKEQEEAIANARLITAAPDLLEACKMALEALEVASNRLGMSHQAIGVLKQAIAKATEEK